MECSISSYGYKNNFFQISGKIIDIPDVNNTNACQPFTNPLVNSDDVTVGHFPIILTEKDGCSYVTKARNIQRASGYAVLIINDNDSPLEKELPDDDGTSADIYIPVIMITKSDGEIIKQFINEIKRDPTKLTEITANIEHYYVISDKISIDLFYSPDDKRMYQFLKSFISSIIPMKEYFDINPTFLVYSDTNQKDSENKNCIGNHKYCYPTSENTYLGKDVVIEGLYQTCIYKIYSDRDSLNYSLEKLLDYITAYLEHCLEDNTNKPFSTDCRNYAIEDAGLNKKEIEACIADSYGEELFNKGLFDNDNNKLLNKALSKLEKYKLKYYPAIYINKLSYDETLDTNKVLYRACTMMNTLTSTCEYILNMHSEEVSDKPKKRGTIFIIIIVLIIILFNIGLLFICKKYLANKISERLSSSVIDVDGRINSTVGKYFQLESKSGIFS